MRGIFLYSKTFLIMSNKLWNIFVYVLIYMLFGNNNLLWELHFRYVGLLEEISVSLGIVCYY